MALFKGHTTLFLVSVFLLVSVAPAQSQDNFRIADDGLTAGYVTLAWDGADNNQYEFQKQQGTSWETVYEGPDTAVTLSGLPNGTYTFRVRQEEGAWSAPLEIKIQHHSLTRAFTFFSMGAVLLFILLFILFRPEAKQATPLSSKRD